MTLLGGDDKPLPDRVFTIAKQFFDRYPNAQRIVGEFREFAEDECGWLEASQDAYTLTISVWYGVDREKCVEGIKPIADALAEWDRHQ